LEAVLLLAFAGVPAEGMNLLYRYQKSESIAKVKIIPLKFLLILPIRIRKEKCMRIKISSKEYQELASLNNLFNKTPKGIYDGFCRSPKCAKAGGGKQALVMSTDKRYARPCTCPRCSSPLLWIRR
jgi:hypothetical protein